MPNYDLSNQPRYPLVTIDSDNVIQDNQIETLFSCSDGVTLCVRSYNGPSNRGGYYFCIKKISESSYHLETIEGDYIDSFDLHSLVRFINHSSGRLFDTDLLDYCQNSVNFRND